MSEIQVGQINSTDGSTAITTGDDGYVSFAKTQIGGRRRLTINGAMQVAQRGTSSVLGNGTFLIDRFSSVTSGVGGDGLVVTGSQEDDAPSGTALKKSFKATVTTAPTQAYDADDYMMIQHRLEHQDISPFLADGSVTLSFWVKSSTTATYGLSLSAQDTDNTSGGAVYATTYAVNSANTWEKKTVVIPVQSDGYTSYTDNALGLDLIWFLEGISGGTRSDMTNNAWNDDAVGKQWTSSASDTGLLDTLNNYWQITGVQLEVGPLATPFEHRSYGEELALCQRYFQEVGRNDAEGGGLLGMIRNGHVFLPHKLTIPMRATPSMTAYGSNSTTGNLAVILASTKVTVAANSLSLSYASPQYLKIRRDSLGSGTNGQACFFDTGTGTDYIGFDFDAEL